MSMHPIRQVHRCYKLASSSWTSSNIFFVVKRLIMIVQVHLLNIFFYNVVLLYFPNQNSDNPNQLEWARLKHWKGSTFLRVLFQSLETLKTLKQSSNFLGVLSATNCKIPVLAFVSGRLIFADISSSLPWLSQFSFLGR